jgi:hypothetical protein
MYVGYSNNTLNMESSRDRLLADHPYYLRCVTRSLYAPCETRSFDITGEERVLQNMVDEALTQGVRITRARRLRGRSS